MWPMLVDMSKDECKRMLRRIELEAYSNIVTAFRAQGDLSKDKKKVLQDLCSILGISTERHRAEVRRAYNDERLATIADQIGGSSYSSEWAIEGRRLIPLMPRLVPQTAFTTVANKVANLTNQNTTVSPPTSVNSKRTNSSTSIPVSASPGSSAGNLENSSSSHQSVGSGHAGPQTSVQSAALKSADVKTPGNTTTATTQIPGSVGENGNLDINHGRKRKRSASVNVPVTMTSLPKMQQGTSTSSATKIPNSVAVTSSARTVSVPVGATPVKITLTTPSQKSTTAVTTTQPQKVILVSTSSSSLSSSILQRSVVVPIVRTVTTTGTTLSVTSSSTPTVQQTKSSSILSSPAMQSPVSVTYSAGSSVASVVTGPTAANSGISEVHKSRAIVAKQKVKQTATTRGVNPSTSSVPIQAIQAKPKAVAKSTYHATSEGPLKVVAPKICPKITNAPGPSGSCTPIVVVAKTVVCPQPAGTHASGTRVVNLITGSAPKPTGNLGPKILKTAVIKRSNVGPLVPNTSVKTSAVLIQKAHLVTSQVNSNTSVVLAKSVAATKCKDVNANVEVSTAVSSTVAAVDIQAVIPEVPVVPSEKTNTVLADLLHAAGILPDISNHSPADTLSSEAELDTTKTQSLELESATYWSEPIVAATVPVMSSDSSVNVPDDTVKSTSTEKLSEQEIIVTPVEQIIKTEHANSPKASDQPEVIKIPDTDPKIAVPSSVTTGKVTVRESTVTGREVLGELDPRTGIFYPYMTSSIPSTVPPKVELTDTTKAIDIFSTAIATAQLDLGSFKLIEEPVCQEGARIDPKPIQQVEAHGPEDKETGKNPECLSEASEEISTIGEVEKVFLDSETVKEDFPKLEELDEMKADDVVEETSVVKECPDGEVPEIEKVTEEPKMEVSDMEPSMDQLSEETDVAVTEEHVEDTMSCEEVNPDKMDVEIDGATASQSGEMSAGVTVGEESSDADGRKPKRKRRSHCVSSMDEILSVPHLSGWARSAMGLLLRVSKFRGSGRKPTDPGAAHWFLQPVTNEEAPGYCDVIKNPMDFSRIKMKLESFQYQDVSEFHQDMMLVKENCELYNPPDHAARKDCEEVFAFYQQEYDRVVEKWQKSHLFSPSPKKSKST